MSYLTDMASTKGIDFALTLCWLLLLVFVTMMTSQRALWPTWYKIRNQNTEYFTDTIVTMRVAKDTVDADIWLTMEVLPFHVRHAMSHSGNPCISSVIVFPLILSIWIISKCHTYDFSSWIMRLWVNVAQQMWRHLNVVAFVDIDVSGRAKASSWH